MNRSVARALFYLSIHLPALAWCVGADAQEVATIDGAVISKQDVDKAFLRTSVSKRKLTAEQETLYRRHVLNVLIDEFLVNRFLDQEKIAADEKKVDEHIATLQKQLKGKGQTLEQFLEKVGIDETRMREDIRGIYRWMAYVERESSDATLRKYYEANKQAFDGSQVRASHILVKIGPNASPTERRAARTKLEEIRSQLAGGTSFAELAKAHSDCPSKAEGGDLNFFPRKDAMSEPFAAAAFALAPGQVSEVVETEFGYHLILVTDKKSGDQIQYEDMLDEVKGQYASDLRTAIVAKMRAAADIQILR